MPVEFPLRTVTAEELTRIRVELESTAGGVSPRFALDAAIRRGYLCPTATHQADRAEMFVRVLNAARLDDELAGTLVTLDGMDDHMLRGWNVSRYVETFLRWNHPALAPMRREP